MDIVLSRRLYGNSQDGFRLGIPAFWARAIGSGPEERLELLLGEVLVVIPPRYRDSAQARRVRTAMGA